MSKKDVIRIAHALAITKPLNERNGVWSATCQNVADALAKDSKRFKRKAFLMACGAYHHESIFDAWDKQKRLQQLLT